MVRKKYYYRVDAIVYMIRGKDGKKIPLPEGSCGLTFMFKTRKAAQNYRDLMSEKYGGVDYRVHRHEVRMLSVDSPKEP